MLRSSSCWFEFYSVITQRETDRDRDRGGREERQRKRKWGKGKEKEREEGRQERRETHIHIHKENASPTQNIISGLPWVKDLVVGLIFFPLLDLKRWYLLLC